MRDKDGVNPEDPYVPRLSEPPISVSVTNDFRPFSSDLSFVCVDDHDSDSRFLDKRDNKREESREREQERGEREKTGRQPS